MKYILPVHTPGNTAPSNSERLHESVSSQLRISIALQVVFGSPSRTCAGSGVCKMLPQTVNIPEYWLCPVWTGQLHFHVSRKSLKLSFPLEQFTSSDLDKWFSDGKFRMEEAFPLPLWIAKLLGVNDYAIPAGRYTYKKHKNLTINLKINKQEKCQQQAVRWLSRGA